MFIEEWWIENATNDSCLPKYDSHTQGLSMSSLETAPYGWRWGLELARDIRGVPMTL